MSLTHSSVFLFIISLAVACANPVSPTGGPKDSTPPKIIAEGSTPNEQVNFNERGIELVFDEWIQLDNAYGQLVISPPLEYRPEIRARGKTLIFNFDERETLLDSVTYTINFGAAVKDNTEGNKVQDLRFVFSTGPVLDSLIVSGKVIDAFSQKPVEGIPVLLFDPATDSVIFHEKPIYYSTTGPDGSYKLQNLRAGNYKIIALKDENSNLKYDLPTEGIGFINELITVSDTLGPGPTIKFSQPLKYEPFTTVVAKDSFHITMGFIGEVKQDIELINMTAERIYYEKTRDSLDIWVESHEIWPDSLILRQGRNYDTIALKTPSGRSLPPNISGNNLIRSKLPPGRELKIYFNQIVSSFDSAGISILDTSMNRLPLVIRKDTFDPKAIVISAPFRAEQDYKLELLPDAVDYWGENTLQDTLALNFKVGKAEDYGRLILDITGLEQETNYWLQILNKDDKAIFENGFRSEGDSIRIDLKRELPGTYNLRVVWDDNDNQKWDPGNYWKSEQPEKVKNIPLGELRANWELKLDVPVTNGN